MKAKVPVMHTHEYLEERIQYLDMLALMVLHTEFGFGAERLKRYYRAISELADAYRRYDDPRGPDWGRKDKYGHEKLVLYALKRDLKAIGFDYDEMVDEWKQDIPKDVLRKVQKAKERGKT